MSSKKKKTIPQRNLVAKFAKRFNKSVSEKSKKDKLRDVRSNWKVVYEDKE